MLDEEKSVSAPWATKKKKLKLRSANKKSKKKSQQPLTMKQTKLIAARLAGKTLQEAWVEAWYGEKSAMVVASQTLSKLNVKQKFQELQNEIILTLYNKLFEFLEDDKLSIQEKVDLVKDLLDRQWHFKKSQQISTNPAWSSSDMLALFMRHKRNGEKDDTIEGN